MNYLDNSSEQKHIREYVKNHDYSGLEKHEKKEKQKYLKDHHAEDLSPSKDKNKNNHKHDHKDHDDYKHNRDDYDRDHRGCHSIINHININCSPCNNCHKCPTGPQTQIRGLEIELQGAVRSITTGAPIIFDTIVSSLASFISYNPLTGTVTITRSGVYDIDWWVSTDGLVDGTDIVITFSIVTSQGDNIQASTPIITGQISGNALISVIASPINPVNLQLVNATSGTIGFGSTPIKADLTIKSVTF